jgi:dihydrofolate synthase/folylpolyglutamate synthase
VALPTTPYEALAYLAAQPPSTIRLGLDRVRAALAALGNPETSLPALHIAGTNGKGSTCAIAASCLQAQGYRVGLYTSPHLELINERIKVQGADISDEVLGQRVLDVVNALPGGLELTYFELGTVVALAHFAKERVDIAVLETGLGGRLDATTASRPVVTAITPVSIDHTEYLGHTVRQIANEKAGIIKPGIPVVLGRQEPSALEAIEKAAQAAGSPVRLLGRDFDFEPESPTKNTFRYRGARTRVFGLEVPLKGPHQIQNAAVAFACLEWLEDRGFAITQENARAGLRQVRWPGRLEELPGDPLVVLDGAHNLGGIEALVKALKSEYPGRGIHLVLGVMGDKDYRSMLKLLLPNVSSAKLVPVPSTRSWNPQIALDTARSANPRCEVVESLSAGISQAKALCGGNDLVLISGSLHLVGEARTLLMRG